MAEGNRLIAEVRLLEDASGGGGIPTFTAWRARSTAAPFPSTDQHEMIFHNNVVWNGKMYLVGHYNEFGEQNTMVSYDEATDTWATLTPIPTPSYFPGIAVVNGKIYVFSTNVSKLQVYDIATDTWVVEAAAPPIAVNDSRAVAIGTTIYILGQGSFHAYDTLTKTYTSKANTPIDAGGDVDLDYLAGKIYAVGSFYVGTAQEKLYSYDVATDTWTALATPPDAGHGLEGYISSSTIYNGEIWKISGQSPNSGTHVYTIATNTWRDDIPPYPEGGGIYFPAVAVINNILLAFGKHGHPGPSSMYSFDGLKYQLTLENLSDFNGTVAEGDVLTAAASGWKASSIGVSNIDAEAATIGVDGGFDFTITDADHSGNTGDYPIILTPAAETPDYRLEPHLSGTRIVVKKKGLWVFWASFYINNAGSGLAPDARITDFFKFLVGTDFTDLEAAGIETYSFMNGARMIQTEHITTWMSGQTPSHLFLTKTNAPVIYSGLPNGHYTGGYFIRGHRLTRS